MMPRDREGDFIFPRLTDSPLSPLSLFLFWLLPPPIITLPRVRHASHGKRVKNVHTFAPSVDRAQHEEERERKRVSMNN